MLSGIECDRASEVRDRRRGRRPGSCGFQAQATRGRALQPCRKDTLRLPSRLFSEGFPATQEKKKPRFQGEGDAACERRKEKWSWVKGLESEANKRDMILLSHGLRAYTGLQIRVDAVVIHSLSFNSALNLYAVPFAPPLAPALGWRVGQDRSFAESRGCVVSVGVGMSKDGTWNQTRTPRM